MEVSTALLQHALDVGHAYKENMAWHHGLEKPERIVIDPPKGAPPQKQPEVSQPPSNVSPTPPATKAPATNLIAPWLIAASLATGGAGLGAAATTWLTKPQTPTPVVFPTNPSNGEDHLLSDLQERGYHLKPKGSKP